ncbi:unannotated protein [freshwater metagenome]|jgi:hypothetical protein|uniref:Unannotated protein n=1 Tax=freshwater metagenome TaxID=449393 RepID=A0A6J6C7P4_9ZZZZ
MLELSLIGASPSHLSGSEKTTTSPRLISLNKAPNLFTAIRSPTCNVFSIEPDGIKKKWRKNVLITIEIIRAETTIMGSSRRNEPFLNISDNA